MRDQIADRAHSQPVLFAKLQQLREPRHGPVGIEDFAQHARRRQPREPRQIHARLRVPRAPQHAAGFCPQRENVTRLHEIERLRFRIDQKLNRPRPVVRADARAHAFRRVDRDREIRPKTLPIFQHHPLQPKLLRPLLRDRRADQPAPMHRHEIHRLRRDLLRRHHEVALILPILIIRHHHHAPGADVFDDVFDGIKLRRGRHGDVA